MAVNLVCPWIFILDTNFGCFLLSTMKVQIKLKGLCPHSGYYAAWSGQLDLWINVQWEEKRCGILRDSLEVGRL